MRVRAWLGTYEMPSEVKLGVSRRFGFQGGPWLLQAHCEFHVIHASPAYPSPFGTPSMVADFTLR